MYGKDQPKNFLIPSMIDNIKNRREILIANRRGLVFNPIHINDAARFVITALKRKKGYNIFNIAGNQNVSLMNVVNEISNLLGMEAIIKNVNKKEQTFLGSISKMKSIDFVHKINLKQGLKQMVL